MNLYSMIGSAIATTDAATLSARLAAWHDAMVAHERKIRAAGGAYGCDDECPHAEAPALWHEAVETFGARATELTFLRSRALRVPAAPPPARSEVRV
jgi:hypothetical protein